MDDILLSVKNLYSGYGGKEVLRDISVDFCAGEITAIVGPNGCGKSTLLKTLIRLVPRTAGTITIAGRDIDSMTTPELARNIAYLAQNKSIPDLTVMSMVLHGRFAHLGYPRRYRKEDMEIAGNALEMTALSEYADQPISALSGGTQQRVFLAMALAQDTPMILMDEPNSFMDIAHQMKLMSLCRELAEQGKGIAVVLHDLPTALKIADKLCVLEKGSIAAFGNTEEVYTSGVLQSVFGVDVRRIEVPDGVHYYY